jgi:hypothetical protein
MRKLKNLKVKLTSILYGEMKPANMEDVIVKAGGFNKVNTFEVTKFDELEGILECIVYRANKVDSQGDSITNEELEKACEWNLDYLIKQGKNTPSDTNHNFEIADNVYLMQTFIDKSESDWAWRQKINIKGNDELMKQAKNKTITGVSLAGEAQIEEEKGMLEKMITKIYDKLFKSDKETDMKKELEDFLKTDEGIKELEALGFTKKETPAETPATEEPKAEPELEKSKLQIEVETVKADKVELEKQLETLKTELEQVKKERDILDKVKTTDPKEPTELTLDEVIEQKKAEMMKKYEVKK